MACIRSCLLYGCETWATRAELESKMESIETRMVGLGWCVVSPSEKDTTAQSVKNSRC